MYDHGIGYHFVDFKGPGLIRNRSVRNNLLNVMNSDIKRTKLKLKKIRKAIWQCKKI